MLMEEKQELEIMAVMVMPFIIKNKKCMRQTNGWQIVMLKEKDKKEVI